MQDKKYGKEEVNYVRTFMEFVLERARGNIETGATFIRNIVLNHPEYQKDSVINQKIAYDLMSTIINMN